MYDYHELSPPDRRRSPTVHIEQVTANMAANETDQTWTAFHVGPFDPTYGAPDRDLATIADEHRKDLGRCAQQLQANININVGDAAEDGTVLIAFRARKAGTRARTRVRTTP